MRRVHSPLRQQPKPPTGSGGQNDQTRRPTSSSLRGADVGRGGRGGWSGSYPLAAPGLLLKRAEPLRQQRQGPGDNHPGVSLDSCPSSRVYAGWPLEIPWSQPWNARISAPDRVSDGAKTATVTSGIAAAHAAAP